MEAPNQDAMLNPQAQTYQPGDGSLMQAPDQNQMLNEEYDPTDLAGDVNRMPTTPTDEDDARRSDEEGMVAQDYGPTEITGERTITDAQRGQLAHQPYTNAQSGRPNMEPDHGPSGTGEVIGNNDGTEPDPEATDMRGGL